MQIGEVIRKYRKSKNMTQEEMANRLGVTAPAVNKWENGNSTPDIMLLAPIARLLGIGVDTLLSFHEELTEEEINDVIVQVGSKVKNETYQEAFHWAKKKLEQYPNCELLMLQTAQILDAHRMGKEIPDSMEYENYINDCYVRVLNSKDEDIRSFAADALFHFYLSKEKYEKAEEYLTYFSKQNPERKRKQAVIYSKTNRIEEAYKAYEELLFAAYQTISIVFHNIYMLAMQEKDTKKAHAMVNKQKKLANLFEMGEYHEISSALELAAWEKDVDKTLEIMKGMLESVEKICAFSKSSLYEHMTFKETEEGLISEIKQSLLENFRDEEAFGFLKAEERYYDSILGKRKPKETKS